MLSMLGRAVAVMDRPESTISAVLCSCALPGHAATNRDTMEQIGSTVAPMLLQFYYNK